MDFACAVNFIADILDRISWVPSPSLWSNSTSRYLFFSFFYNFIEIKKKSTNNSNAIDWIYPIQQTFWSFALIWSFCEIGERVSHQFNAFDAELCQCKWYLYPVDVQQMLLIFMGNAQQPILIRSYGGIACTRDSFEKVWKFWIFNLNFSFFLLFNCAFLFRPFILDFRIF